MLLWIVYLVYLVQNTDSLLCFNGTFSHKQFGDDPLLYRGIFSPGRKASARLRCALTILCPDNAMCFVRAWSARAQHSWLVQRGCYQPVGDDPLSRSLNIPRRAMSCKYERLPEAEYKVCLCQADWCNSSTKLVPILQNIVKFFRRILFLF